MEPTLENGFIFGDNRWVPGVEAPKTGTWKQGDKVLNSRPVAGGVVGWVCIQGGTPGTWTTFGRIGD